MEEILQNIKKLKVAVIGDIILDHYVWGDAERISPEAPVPVVQVAKDTYVPGGAANVALNIASLGAKAVLIGHTSRDDAGGQLSTILHAKGVSYDVRFCKCEAPTIIKTRVIVRNQQLCRIDRESNPLAYAFDGDEEQWELIAHKLSEVDAIIFSDYAKGVVTENLIKKVQAFAKKKNLFLAMDPKPKRSLKFNNFDLLTPNRTEALLMSRMEMALHEKYPFTAVSEEIWKNYSPSNLVITLGAEGMVFSQKGSPVKLVPTVTREVYDVSGAGDTVVAMLTLALAAKFPIEEAVQFANVAASIVVGKVGTATVSPHEILAQAQSLEPALM